MEQPLPEHAHDVVLVTCEHAGNEVPAEYRALFSSPEAQAALTSHRGYDPGALDVARLLAERLGVPLLAHHVTRLLIELNRSPGNPQLLSPWTRDLPEDQRRTLIDRYHTPHWTAVRQALDGAIGRGRRAVHLAVHSFTDVLDGQARELELGLLFDPHRRAEAELCRAWRKQLDRARPGLRVRFNEPYQGTDDGLTTAMRAMLPGECYLGIEIELRQGLLAKPGAAAELAGWLADTLPGR